MGSARWLGIGDIGSSSGRVAYSTSLVSWDTLGRMGRDFVATATTAQELSMFHGADVKLPDPVRVYVGVRSADSAAERAGLAVRELERAGGFDRKVLVVWVPTGTGWMIPKAAAALELLHRGDTAIVAIQYWFLPSLVAVFVHAGLANEAGNALFTRERDSGSPVWLPVFDRGRSVRFLNRDPGQPASDTEWSAPRIVYLQHGSDPVAFWSVEALWWPPEWMARPRGFDVPANLRWFPIVSGVQSVGDFLDQLGPPPGFGHDYSTDYVRAWASIVPPEGWAQADTERLEQFVDSMTGDDSEP